jgi:predicted nucleic acid-binding Zn ribbon protein
MRLSDTFGKNTNTDIVGKKSNKNSVRNTLILTLSAIALIVVLSVISYTNTYTDAKWLH